MQRFINVMRTVVYQLIIKVKMDTPGLLFVMMELMHQDILQELHIAVIALKSREELNKYEELDSFSWFFFNR